jgi:5-methylcytosine-specific restriction protein A
MPSAPPSACTCGGKRTNGVCDRCGPKKRPTDQRQHAAARGYDYQWQKFREQYLAYHPLCVDCQKAGAIAGATDIHHIRKLKDRPDLKYDEGNLMPLCKMHHDKRTARGE